MSHRANHPNLSIVIVAWHSDRALLDCVRSLSTVPAGGVVAIELIVVDNASSGFPADELVACWPDVKLIRNDANRGFGPAANQGAAIATGEAVLFLNPDTRAVSDPFTPLIEAFRLHSEAVAAAPRLLNDRNVVEEPQERFQLRHLPSWGQTVRELLLFDKAFPGNRWTRRDRYADRDRETPFEVEQPAAAALAVRREAFAAVGGFDETFVPAWFEDVDLCARLSRHGTILYWPASRFVHEGGSAREQLGYDRFLPIYYRNAYRYWRKHRALTAAVVYRALVIAGMTMRLAVLPVLPSHLGSRRQAARAYLRVLIAATGLSRGFQLGRAQEVATLASATPRPLISRLPGGPNGSLASLSLSAVAGARLLAKSGPLAFSRRLWDRITGSPPRPIDDPLLAGYPGWWAREVGSTAGKEREPGRGASPTSAPTFSIIMPVFNPPLRFLQEAIASVRAQTYPQWELVIADDGSRREVLDELRRFAADDPRVRLAGNGQTHGISTATNRALGVARGDWVGFVDHDDLLAPTAIAEVAAALARQPALDALYTDRDSIDERGHHLAPYFKPDWSPHALLSHNYAIHFLVVRRDVLARLGGLRSAFDGAQDYDLLLRLAEATERVGHVPRVLYSWRRHAASNLGTPRPNAFDAGRRAIGDAVARRGLSGRVELSAPAGPYRTRLEPRGEPLVSVIVSSCNPELLESCFASLRSRTRYPRTELLLATNEIGHVGLAAVCAAHAAEIVEVENGFFSLMNNAAAGRARGEVLVFLNDDTRIETPDWIEVLLGTLELPGVAAVGPKLVYPNGRVQFTRVVMGIRADGVPYFFDPFDHYGLPYLFGFSLDVATEVSSVSGGCMMVRREEFLDSGGFPAGEFATSYQDVSWSLGMRRRGRSIVYTPLAAVTHWGSFSKKQDDRLLEREIRIATLFFSAHQAELDRPDPFWNPNLLEAGGFMEPPRFPGLPRFSRRGM